ncbi:MAG: cell division protein ZapB [Spirochaetaceae bacterium]|jgi:chromosome segregation ATPase|nr:cell division protein ZapB [Spirochaetaceae bacterium]
MVSLEQIKLLESRVSRALDIVTRVTEENSFLKGKLETYQKRIDELEVLIARFREDQSRIEEGIISALENLSRFEDAVEGGARREAAPSAAAPPAPAKSGEAAKSGDPARTEGTAAASVVNIPAEEESDEPLIFDEAEETEASGGGTELDIF